MKCFRKSVAGDLQVTRSVSGMDVAATLGGDTVDAFKNKIFITIFDGKKITELYLAQVILRDVA